MKDIIVTLMTLLSIIIGHSQESQNIKNEEKNTRNYRVFAAYDLGEMAFNKFQNFSGEIGIQLKNKNLIRFSYLNVKLTEEHLSGDFARDVDGDNVAGLMKGYELFYDVPIISNFNLGLSVGYFNDFYKHTILNESVENFSGTIGFAPGYRETDLFNIKGMYYNFVIPFRFYLNPLDETKLGDSTVKRHSFTNTIHFYIGYQF